MLEELDDSHWGPSNLKHPLTHTTIKAPFQILLHSFSFHPYVRMKGSMCESRYQHLRWPGRVESLCWDTAGIWTAGWEQDSSVSSNAAEGLLQLDSTTIHCTFYAKWMFYYFQSRRIAVLLSLHDLYNLWPLFRECTQTFTCGDSQWRVPGPKILLSHETRVPPFMGTMVIISALIYMKVNKKKKKEKQGRTMNLWMEDGGWNG